LESGGGGAVDSAKNVLPIAPAFGNYK